MLPARRGARSRPKSLRAIDEHIFNQAPMPFEVQAFLYRKLFKLSYEQFLNEPIDEFFTNFYIYAQIKEKERLESKHH